MGIHQEKSEYFSKIQKNSKNYYLWSRLKKLNWTLQVAIYLHLCLAELRNEL